MSSNQDFVIENGVLKKYNGPGGDVTIPAGVTDIEEDAFWDCAGLTGVTIPEGVTGLKARTFNTCKDLVRVTIPMSVTEIEWGPFRDCTSLSEIFVDADHPVYRFENGMLLSKDSLLLCARDKTGDVTIPEGITEIGAYAFSDCKGLTGVTIPAGVTEIEWGAFRRCTGLTNVTIPEGVTKIGYGVFAACSGLTSIVLPNSLKTVSEYAFLNCTSLTSVKLPENQASVDDLAFYGCTSLCEVVFPGVGYLGYSAFENCTGLRRMIFQKRMPTAPQGWGSIFTEFGNFTLHAPFEGCENIRTVECHMENIDWKKMWYVPNVPLVVPDMPISEVDKDRKWNAVWSFAQQYVSGADIPEEIRAGYLKYIKGQRKRLYQNALDTPELMQVMVQEKVIPQKDFDGILEQAIQRQNPALTAMLLEYQEKNLVREDPLTKADREFKAIERQAAVQEKIAETNILPPGEAKKIWRYEKRDEGGIRLLGYKGTELRVRIPYAIGKEPVAELAYGCLSPETSPLTEAVRWVRKTLQSVEIPDTIEVIGDNVMLGCLKLTEIILSPEHPQFYIKEGMLLTRDDTRLLHVLNGYTGACTVPPDTLQTVGKHFQGKDITELVIPSYLLDGDTLQDCRELKKLTVTAEKEGYIPYEFGIPSLETAVLEEGVCTISEGAFKSCSWLKTVALPESLTRIDKSAFASCHKLTDIVLPGKLSYLGERAFAFNRAMTSITIPGGVKKIRKSAFEGCLTLKKVVVQSGVQAIGDKAFLNCKELEEITLPVTTTKFGENVFDKCPNLTIHAPAGSSAEAYAKRTGIPFQAE